MLIYDNNNNDNNNNNYYYYYRPVNYVAYKFQWEYDYIFLENIAWPCILWTTTKVSEIIFILIQAIGVSHILNITTQMIHHPIHYK